MKHRYQLRDKSVLYAIPLQRYRIILPCDAVLARYAIANNSSCSQVDDCVDVDVIANNFVKYFAKKYAPNNSPCASALHCVKSALATH